MEFSGDGELRVCPDECTVRKDSSLTSHFEHLMAHTPLWSETSCAESKIRDFTSQVGQPKPGS